MTLKFNAPVVLSFSLICVAVYVLDTFSGHNVLPYFTVQPQIQWSNPFSVFTLFTHVLGHVSLDHLMGNLTFILLLGPILEEKFGSKTVLYMILFTAFITGIINVLFFNTGLTGASGIVFMMILLVSFTNVKAGEIPITFILIAILFIGKEFLNSLNHNQISESAHIIGGICGSIFGFRLMK
ncbi:MAG: rhomboid family intramembrane serine protease [Lewinellaceae bacterium]|nr:rhomboid family intramembrane serine protease [Lewinellaceae bacterium]